MSAELLNEYLKTAEAAANANDVPELRRAIVGAAGLMERVDADIQRWAFDRLAALARRFDPSGAADRILARAEALMGPVGHG